MRSGAEFLNFFFRHLLFSLADPQQIFFPTVLMNSAVFNGSMGEPSTVPDLRLPHMQDMWYIRMDEHYPWSNFNQARYPLDVESFIRWFNLI
jgi:hypothetical protein